MDSDRRLKVETHLNMGYTSNVTRGSNHYAVVTEKLGTKEVSVITSVYHKGKAISRMKTDFKKKIDPMDANALELEIRKQHFKVLKEVESGRVSKEKKPRDYIDETKTFLRKQSKKKAMAVLSEGYELYPDDPFILSYYGCLTSIVDKKHKDGIEACQRALDKLAQKFPIGLDISVKPLFYLNLCRAYLAGGEKRKAVNTLFKGMRFDTENGILHQELVKLGARRKPFFDFLKRSNLINKYIGLMLHSMEKKDKAA